MFCQTGKLGSSSLFDMNSELKWSSKLSAKIFSKFQSKPNIILTEGSGECDGYNLDNDKSIDDIKHNMIMEDQQLNCLTCCGKELFPPLSKPSLITKFERMTFVLSQRGDCQYKFSRNFRLYFSNQEGVTFSNQEPVTCPKTETLVTLKIVMSP